MSMHTDRHHADPHHGYFDSNLDGFILAGGACGSGDVCHRGGGVGNELGIAVAEPSR